jgi:hypothetical protein
MPLIGVEAAAVSLAAWSAAAIVIAYAADRLGFTITPLPILALSIATAAAIWLRLRRGAPRDAGALATALSIAATTFAWLMWLARPDFLPTGTGSDLAHHLALLAYLERHWRLVHDAAAGAYLGEMIDYTPGAHLLVALAGAWLRRDALHVLHAIVALTVALKCVLVFLIARRLMPDEVPRVPFAIGAALLLWLPYTFFAGSFMAQSFFSQVVSELFAVAMWWTIVWWGEAPSVRAMALFALFGSAAFLTWPVWVGPLVLTLVISVWLRGRADKQVRPYSALTVALLPIAILAAIYAGTRTAYGFDMIHAVGFVVRPLPATMTWTFLILAAGGLVNAALLRPARPAAIFAAAIGAQAIALIGPGLRGAAVPYLSLKMAYLAIYPMSVAAAVLLARIWRATLPPAVAARYAWTPILAIALGVARSLALLPPATPVITQSVFLAGEWARTHVPPACVDYLVADGYTGYWLHLAVLGNPRAAGRALDDDTFEPSKALVRWILPGGLPYAIADRFDALPRDIREHVDVLARFGPAAVVQRRGSSRCPAH